MHLFYKKDSNFKKQLKKYKNFRTNYKLKIKIFPNGGIHVRNITNQYRNKTLLVNTIIISYSK